MKNKLLVKLFVLHFTCGDNLPPPSHVKKGWPCIILFCAVLFNPVLCYHLKPRKQSLDLSLLYEFTNLLWLFYNLKMLLNVS